MKTQLNIGQQVKAKNYSKQNGIVGTLRGVEDDKFIVEYEGYHLYTDKGTVTKKFLYCEAV